MNGHKILPQHLERTAYVYVRQSSQRQVEEHLESQDLQYQLVHRAQALGRPESQVVVIDDDLGKSAVTATEREGFQILVAAVGLGQVGIILVTDVSRLARNCGDWYQLLDLASVCGTLLDLDLTGRKLMVRKGKGLSDRAVYLTDTVVAAVRAYLPVRGLGPTDHVFLYRNLPLCKDLVRGRLKAAGERTGVKVYPHRLRHTCATQLLNAGCRVTSIQKFLGHKRLNSTMVYARVHDQTVADDSYSAMTRVEQRFDIAPPVAQENENNGSELLNDDEREQVLDLIDQLANPDLSAEERIDLAERMRQVLNHNGLAEKEKPTEQENGRRPRGPPGYPLGAPPAFPWVNTL